MTITLNYIVKKHTERHMQHAPDIAIQLTCVGLTQTHPNASVLNVFTDNGTYNHIALVMSVQAIEGLV